MSSTEAKVTVGSPATPYLPNGSNEPALAMDANLPAVLAAGANDLIDSVPCQGSSCDLTPDIGISGVYFSFDSGATWTQPACTGPTAQNGTTRVGPIHTLPGYFEHGMSKGRPAMILTAPGGRVNVPAPLRYRETGSQHCPAPSTIVTAAKATEAA